MSQASTMARTTTTKVNSGSIYIFIYLGPPKAKIIFLQVPQVQMKSPWMAECQVQVQVLAAELVRGDLHSLIICTRLTPSSHLVCAPLLSRSSLS